MLRLVRRLHREESGAALVAVVMTTLVFSLLAVGVVANSIHSNDSTTMDRHRENAFQAASAGVDDALDCLSHIAVGVAYSTCSKTATSATQLTQSGNNIGQYAMTLTDVTPVGSPTTIVKVVATGYGPQQANSYLPSTRVVTAEVNMVPLTGFFDSIFAGDELSQPTGDASFKNGSNVPGTVYAGSWDSSKNVNNIGDLQVRGNVSTVNGDTYNSIWSGSSVTLAKSTVQTNAKACGAVGSSTGDFANGGTVNGNITYKGSFNPKGTYGSSTPGGCSAPPDLDIPTFTYNANNYPGWTVIPFTTAAAANQCLATANSITSTQQSKCLGYSLGDKNATIGKSTSGTVVYVNDPTCSSTVSMGNNVTYTGNFTLISTCNLDPFGGTFTKDASAPNTVQAAFIAIGGDNALINVPNSSMLSSPTGIDVLVYSTGYVTAQNKFDMTGAVYARHISFKNKPNILTSTSLGSSPPAGFTFSSASATTYTPVVRSWRETAS